MAILNADGVYLATYSALLLNLKLMYMGYYASQEKSLPLSEVWYGSNNTVEDSYAGSF